MPYNKGVLANCFLGFGTTGHKFYHQGVRIKDSEGHTGRKPGMSEQTRATLTPNPKPSTLNSKPSTLNPIDPFKETQKTPFKGTLNPKP